jgi:V8-like Glu-specific endopeptidase
MGAHLWRKDKNYVRAFRIMIAVGLAAAAGAAAYVTPGLAAPPRSAVASAANTVDSPGLVPVFDPNTGASEMLDPDTAASLITAYWTPDQVAAATPVPNPPDTSAPDGVADGTPMTVFTPSVSSLAGRVQMFGLTFPMPFVDSPVGKVLFRDPADGKNHFCSGSAINTPKKRMVLTAGHCVHDKGGGGWMQNWVFDPGFKNGPGPAGSFTPVNLFAWSNLTQGGDKHYDYGVVITHINGGGKLGSQVGGNGLIVNPGRPFVTSIGYSSDTISNQGVQEFCRGQLSRRSVVDSDQSLPCVTFGGASGSPWLENLHNGIGDVVSNAAYILTPTSGNPVFGPYYDSDTATLALTAEASSP